MSTTARQGRASLYTVLRSQPQRAHAGTRHLPLRSRFLPSPDGVSMLLRTSTRLRLGVPSTGRSPPSCMVTVKVVAPPYRCACPALALNQTPASHPTMHPFQTSSAPCHDSSHAAVARPSKRLCHDGASIASANAAAIAAASRVVLPVDCSGVAAATGADADHCVGDGDAVDGDGDGDGCDYSSQRRARGQGGQRRGQGMQGSHASRTLTPLGDDLFASSSSSSVPSPFAPASDAGVRD